MFRHPSPVVYSYTHRPLSSSFLGLYVIRILYGNPNKELLRGPWVAIELQPRRWEAGREDPLNTLRILADAGFPKGVHRGFHRPRLGFRFRVKASLRFDACRARIFLVRAYRLSPQAYVKILTAAVL